MTNKMCVRKVHKLRDVLRGEADYELGGKACKFTWFKLFSSSSPETGKTEFAVIILPQILKGYFYYLPHMSLVLCDRLNTRLPF